MTDIDPLKAEDKPEPSLVARRLTHAVLNFQRRVLGEPEHPEPDWAALTKAAVAGVGVPAALPEPSPKTREEPAGYGRRRREPPVVPMPRLSTAGDKSTEDRPPAYLSCASLARELNVSETTVHEMTRRGVIPQPVKLSAGCVRWCWFDVQAALASLSGGGASEAGNDPFLVGVRNATRAV
jgi:predicted DNA-binding transcriptional regulator AlpA